MSCSAALARETIERFYQEWGRGCLPPNRLHPLGGVFLRLYCRRPLTPRGPLPNGLKANHCENFMNPRAGRANRGQFVGLLPASFDAVRGCW